MGEVRLESMRILPLQKSTCFNRVVVEMEFDPPPKVLVLHFHKLAATTYMRPGQTGHLHALMLFHFIMTEKIKKDEDDLVKKSRCFLEHVRSDTGTVVGARLFLVTSRNILGMEDAMFARNKKMLKEKWAEACPCYATKERGSWVQAMDRLFGDLGGLHATENPYDIERMFKYREIEGARALQQDVAGQYIIAQNNEWVPPSPLDMVELLPEYVRPERFSKLYRRGFQNIWLPPLALRVGDVHLVDRNHPLVRSLNLEVLNVEMDAVYRDLAVVNLGESLSKFREKTLNEGALHNVTFGKHRTLYLETELDWKKLEARHGNGEDDDLKTMDTLGSLDIVEFLKMTDMPPEQKTKEFLTCLMDADASGLPGVGRSAAKHLSKKCDRILKRAYPDLTDEGNILVLLANVFSDIFFERRVDRDVFMATVIRTLSLMRRRPKEPNLCLILAGVGGTGKTRWLKELLEEFVLSGVVEDMDMGSALIETASGNMHSRIVTQGEGQLHLIKPDKSKQAEVNASNMLKILLSEGKITTQHLDIDHDSKKRRKITTRRKVEQIRIMCENHIRRADLKGTPFDRRCYVLLFKKQEKGLYCNGKDDVRSFEASASAADKEDARVWTNFFLQHHAWSYVICSLIHVGALDVDMSIFDIAYNRLKEKPDINLALTKRFCEAHCIFMAIAKVLFAKRETGCRWKGFREGPHAFDRTYANFQACVDEIKSHLCLTEEQLIYVMSFMEEEVCARDDQIMHRALYETYLERRADRYHYVPTGEMRREVDIEGREINTPVLDYTYTFIKMNGRGFRDMAKKLAPAIVTHVQQLGGEIDVDSAKQFLINLTQKVVKSGIYPGEQPNNLTGLARANGLGTQDKTIMEEYMLQPRGLKIATAYFEPFRNGGAFQQGSIYSILEEAFCYSGQTSHTYILGNLYRDGDTEDPRQLGIFKTHHVGINSLTSRSKRPNQSRRFITSRTKAAKRQRLDGDTSGTVHMEKYHKIQGNLEQFMVEKGFCPSEVGMKSFRGRLTTYEQLAKDELRSAQIPEDMRDSEDEESWEVTSDESESEDENDQANGPLVVHMGQNPQDESGSESDASDASDASHSQDSDMDIDVEAEKEAAIRGLRHGIGSRPGLHMTLGPRDEYQGGNGFFDEEADDG